MRGGIIHKKGTQMNLNKRWSLCVVLIHSWCLGYYYCAYILESKQPLSLSCNPKYFHGNNKKNKQYIVCIGDFHCKNHSSHEKQKQNLDLLLQACLQKKGKLIIEDLSSINNDGKGICGKYTMDGCGVLGKLADKARAMGIDVDNIEYRYCRVAALAPLLNNSSSNPYSFRSTKNITLFSLYNEIIDQIKKIQKYNDNELLNALYKSTTAAVQKNVLDLCLNNRKQTSVAHYCSGLWIKKNYRDMLEKLCIFDSALLDMTILHSITTSKDTSLILVVAGGSHIEHIQQLLTRFLSYQLLYSIAAPANKRQPIDLQKISDYVKKINIQ